MQPPGYMDKSFSHKDQAKQCESTSVYYCLGDALTWDHLSQRPLEGQARGGASAGSTTPMQLLSGTWRWAWIQYQLLILWEILIEFYINDFKTNFSDWWLSYISCGISLSWIFQQFPPLLWLFLARIPLATDEYSCFNLRMVKLMDVASHQQI